MTVRSGYLDYVGDERFADDYRDYQRRYAEEPRESDKVIVDLIRAESEHRGADLAVLDAGCSTGNLLRHIRRALPSARLTGGDLMPAHLEECRGDPELAGVALREMDVTTMDETAMFDVVTVNAVLCILDESAYSKALRRIGAALAPEGLLISFDWLHPFEQELEIRERSRTHPAGMSLHFRSFEGARTEAGRAGLESVEFLPFEIPIELPRPADDGDLRTFTRAWSGGRMLFRGALAQPWCHMLARAGR